MDYNNITEESLGFNVSPSVTPPVFPRNQRGQPHPYSPTTIPGPSGGSTPNRGRGGRGGGFTPRGAATPDRGGGRGRGRGNFDGAFTPPHLGGGGRSGQRGRGVGGLGFGGVGGRGGALGAGGRGGGFSQFASPRGGYGNTVVGMPGGAHRPLLVPVKFVPATNFAYGLHGNAHETDKDAVGEMADQVHAGNLDELVGSGGEEEDEDKEDSENENVAVAIGVDVELEEEDSEDAEESREVERSLLGSLAAPTDASAAVEVEIEVDASLTIEAALEQATLEDDVEVETIAFEDFIQDEGTPPLLDEPIPMDEEPPLFVIDTTPSAIQAGPGRHLLTRGGQAPLGIASTPSEHVFKPRVISIVDDVAIAPVFMPAFESAPATPPPASALPPRTRDSAAPVHAATPAAKLSKNDKRRLKTAGKKARKTGKEHARSGNQHQHHQHHGFNEYSSDEDVDEDDLKAGAALFATMGAGAADVEDLDDELMDGVPRQGDSDLDWGEATPVMRGGLGSARAPGQVPGASTGRARRAERKEQREAQKEAEKLDRLAANARRAVEAELGSAAAQDYEANLGLGEDSDADDGGNAIGDAEFAAIQRSFVAGLLGPETGAQQKTLAELALEARAQMEDDMGWRTTDGEDETGEESSSTELDTGDEIEMDYSLATADAEVDAALAAEEDAMIPSDGNSLFDSSLDSAAEDLAIQQALLAGGKIRLQSMGVGGPGGRRDAKQRRETKVADKRARKGKGKAVYVSSSSSSDDDDDEFDSDDDMFNGKSTWADQGDDYIAEMHQFLDDNKDLLMAQDRKERKKMFKAIEGGDFRGIDFDDDFAPSRATKTGRKAKAPHSLGGGDFADELQAQWDRDRSKKGDYKRARALARAEAAEAATQHRPLGKHSKPPKHGRREVPAEALNGPASDVALVNAQIRSFLMFDLSSQTLALPPMSKKSRVAVHLLSEVYQLKSKSMGTGKARFPVLERTARSGVAGIDQRKVNAILGTAAGERQTHWGGAPLRGKQLGLMRALEGKQKGAGGGGGGGGGGGKKHNEGAVVGQGADRLGEGNLGFALLKKMGWTEGAQMGLSGGISEPIAARIKNSKGGLGSGFSVSRSEAVFMAAAPRSAVEW